MQKTNSHNAAARFALTVACPSAPGQVAALVRFLDERSCYIDEFDVFDDEFTSRFFVRCVFHGASAQTLQLSSLRDGFAALAKRFDMEWAIHDLSVKPKVLIMVSKFDHCLADLLFRWRMEELQMDIVGIISNHPDLEPLATANHIAWHHLPLTADTKSQQEAQVLALVERTGAELVVLARYMQVLSADLCRRLANRAINIHHSFLPGFKGAKPYHQAHARGVKLIGATAHFVTDDLDEGPIIEQVVERVDHASHPERLLATGRDVECLALARAVKWFIERRTFINGNRTVVLQ
ncbi:MULTISPECIES: formyltetrahydrofolate deformylase [Caballeronia]|uniref:Formyltetrahydrofolate deformylase n=1 Tax=Caballeronia zhejiangensis TaxID=871203 RepID=A0A656Q8A7_9BURK|nr:MULTISPECIES: formyltetrahydrofolate deformylase [Caballeronia]EKS71856.1 formyltetrahydrofolate deformylase [Burkholderia sp. SJ98]KAK45398.1 formyltetrahydrofolate deformylase [Caballeronia jiangsuensis]KDR24995.1 formyltetrahydrofolate deformylase [Caballeronia zhejiangensis]MDR5748158.1 formyltetrahydrofolate deformylase [Caballeronia sp. LZ029]